MLKRKKNKNSWSAFAGQSMTSLTHNLENVLQTMNIDYEKQAYFVPSLQSLFLGGGKKGKQFKINGKNGIMIKFIPAFADPITRVVFGFTSSEKKIKDMQKVSVVEINFNVQDETLVGKIFKKVNNHFQRPLWDISHHPRFQTAVVLARRIRRQWNRWL